MTQVNFSGSGIESIDNQVGKGQGLKVGTTKINFDSGRIQFNDAETIGNFRTLRSKGKKSNTVRSFAFKSTTKCILEFQDTFINYNLINEWIILQGIETELISIVRTATGLTTDIFDFSFIASDNENYKVSIEKGTRDSDLETIFPSVALRAVDTYTQNVNVQGAKKLILTGKATGGSGLVTFTGEVFDPASGDWIELIPVEDIFTLIDTESKIAQLGDTISRFLSDANIRYLQYDSTGGGNPTLASNPESATMATNRNFALVPETLIGYVLPSGDSLFRIKAVVSTDTLTFSLGAIKVFE